MKWNPSWTTPASVGVAFTAGAAVGYFVARRKFDRDIDKGFERINEIARDAESVRRTTHFPMAPHMSEINIIGANEREKLLGAKFAATIAKPDSLEIEDPVEPPAEPAPPVTNVFDAAAWNQEEEEEDRGPNAPYILHENEFHNRERGFPQEELRWFDEDKVLCNDEGLVIYDVNGVVGQLIFGRGARNPDEVYIRNEQLRGEYHITRIYGSYHKWATEMAAEEKAESDDLKHSQRVPKFRMD